MQITDITTLGRSIDLNYPTNRAIAAFAALVIVGGTILQLAAGTALIQSFSWGVAAGLAVFLAWAFCRELDPDHDLSAFVGAGLALVGLLFFARPDLGALLWVLLLLRVVNRTVGLPAKPIDSLGFLGLGGWLAWQGNWMYGLMTALAFFLDSRLSRPNKRHQGFAVVALIGTAILLAVRGIVPGDGLPSPPVMLAILGVCALFVPLIVASRQLRTVGDETGEPLDPRRVQAAQILALLIGLQIALWNGDPGVKSVTPLWAALLGTSLYKIFLVGRRSAPPEADG